MNQLIDIVIAPFRYIVNEIFTYNLVDGLTIGGLVLVAGIFAAVISIISRSSVSFGSSFKGFKSEDRESKWDYLVRTHEEQSK